MLKNPFNKSKWEATGELPTVKIEQNFNNILFCVKIEVSKLIFQYAKYILTFQQVKH